ncbi:hypothetical protein GSI_02548 [Ganoderma sinense ZZ0214-1]|uniref:Uncharacterized protein n=1 Tax=Ganoderma sinense ZZ0214-1 TaxID=1077348 RepID=A0A2G8SLY3_9APHY|nr:hypothetical protein GSI_02548 [Ganoderma sinense ZZ0214-1]
MAATTAAIQHLIDEVSQADADFFAIKYEPKDNDRFMTRFNNVPLVLEYKGVSSATTAPSLHLKLELGAYHPAGVPAYNIWVNNAKTDSEANQAAAVKALRKLLDEKARNTCIMFSASTD